MAAATIPAPKTQTKTAGEVTGLLNRIKAAKAQKTAGDKTAGDGAPSSAHPTDGLADGTMTPKEGERGRENSADTKKTVPHSTDSGGMHHGDGVGAEKEVGLRRGDAEDTLGGLTRGLETHAKDTPTSSPATTNKPDRKYGSAKELRADFGKVANQLMAHVAVVAAQGTSKTAAPAEPTDAAKTAVAPAAKLDAPAAPEVKAAAVQGETQGQTSSEKMVKAALDEAIHAADLVNWYLATSRQHKEAIAKKAAGLPPGGDGAPGPGGGGGGGDAPSKPMPQPIADAGGGAPPGMPGGDPSAGDPSGGGAPPGDPTGGAPGGAPGGGIDLQHLDPQQLQMLLMALQEMHMGPDEMGQQGAAKEPELAPKMAKAAKEFARAGHYQNRPAKEGKERSEVNAFKNYIRELTSK